MAGKLYGIGVGPGDPEQMTLKAVRFIRLADVIAVPGKDVKQSLAYRVAERAVPGLERKIFIPLEMPMSRDEMLVAQAHERGGERIIEFLKRGLNVGYLTLGDPTIYSSFSYLERIVRSNGYDTEYINGVPSFCAAAARFQTPLCEGEEQLHIVPANMLNETQAELSGTWVIMKSSGKPQALPDLLCHNGRQVMAIERCELPDERKYQGVANLPDEMPYLSLIIAKTQKQ